MGTGNGTSEGRADYKVPGGKLIRVRLIHRNGIIESVRFNGDFFMHPEEAMEKLEGMLAGKEIDEAYAIIDDFLRGVEVAGASADDFKKALKMAING